MINPVINRTKMAQGVTGKVEDSSLGKGTITLLSSSSKIISAWALISDTEELFDVGNPGTLQTSAYIFRREADSEARQNAIETYFRLVKEPDSEVKRQLVEEALASMQRAVVCGYGATDENGKPADRQLPTVPMPGSATPVAS